MKMIKSLVLGSAAGLVAMSGAQAADLPVKAKPVEYVRICSLYGAGFYYIPGTDTCIKLGGYLRVETGFWTNSIYNGAYNGAAGANNRFSNHYTARSREDLNIDTRTATEYGVVRTFFDATFSWTTGSFSGTPSTYAGDGVALGTLGVYYAFIQFAGFTMGKAISQFSTPWTNYPANNFDGLVGGSGDVTGVNQFSYTADFGSGMSFTVSAQDQVGYYQTNIWNTSFPAVTGTPAVISSTVGATILTGPYGSQALGGAWAPDLVAMFRADQAWGLFQASFAAHNNHATYYGLTEPTGHPDDTWGWAAQLGLSIKNIPTGAGDSLNIQAVYTDGASRYNFQDLVPTTFAMFGGSSAAYQSIGFASVADTVYGVVGGIGTGQQKVQTWGMRGGYTHNWDPFWNTGIYGAYAEARYGGIGSALVCANVTPFLLPGGTCDPNFAIAQVGLITRWTPVKNLTFSADVNYTHLDQRHSGFIVAPTALTAIAKPATVYELKDQDRVTLLLRAQRNW